MSKTDLYRHFDAHGELLYVGISGKNRKVTPRAVRNWIRCENTPHFRFVLTVYALAQGERIAKALLP